MPKASQLTNNRKLLITVIVAFTIVIWLRSLFAVTVTPSLKYKVFYVNKFAKHDDIKAGDYVLFRIEGRSVIPSALLPTKIDKAIKQVGCVEGSIMAVAGKDFFCNGMFLGTAKVISLSGMEIQQSHFTGVIPPGKMFVLGHHQDSIDSRYFGLIDKTSVIARVLPIF